MNRYQKILDALFQERYSEGATSLRFSRDDMEQAALSMGIERPKNLGDIVYSFRFRTEMPRSISSKAPEGMEWVIRGAGKGQYVLELVERVRIRSNESLVVTKIPDATPEIIRASAQGDEQALLAIVRYNRLLDVFLGVTSYSLQNHLRTTVKGIGQVEIDEIYVGIDRFGQQYVFPVQAKGHSDEIGVTQPEQDLAACQEKWPNMIARSIAVQFIPGGVIAMFELSLQDGQIRVLRESHYRLVPFGEITEEDYELYGRLSGKVGELISL